MTYNWYMNINRILAALLALSMIYIVAPARADDAGACYTITNMDARNYCIAKARHQPGMCYAIQRGDLRAECLAETRHATSHR